MKYQIITLTVAVDLDQADDFYALDQILIMIDDDPAIRIDEYTVHDAYLVVGDPVTCEAPVTQLATPTDELDVDELDDTTL